MGWGKSQHAVKNENTPLQALMNVVPVEVCFENGRKLTDIYSKTQFCAIGEDAGPCSGDSGIFH